MRVAIAMRNAGSGHWLGTSCTSWAGRGGATCGRHKRTELQHAPVCNWSFVSASRTHRYGVTSLRFARALIRYTARGKACTTNDTLTNSVCNEQPPAHHNHEHAAQPAEAGSYVSALWAVVGARANELPARCKFGGNVTIPQAQPQYVPWSRVCVCAVRTLCSVRYRCVCA